MTFILASIRDSILATMMIGLSLYVWRLGYAVSDWAILALTPLSVFLYLGFWRLVLNPWQAKLLIALRESSPLAMAR